MKSWLQHNDIEMYSTHKKRKYIVAEIFIKTLTNKIYKYITSISKNLYIDKLDDIVNKCNNTHHSTIKTELVGVNSSPYIDFNKDNKEDPTVIMSEYRNTKRFLRKASF